MGDFLIGPVSCTRQVGPNGEIVYIFGDYHHYKPKCEGDNRKGSIKLNDLLENTFLKYKDITIDLFTETAYEGKDSVKSIERDLLTSETLNQWFKNQEKFAREILMYDPQDAHFLRKISVKFKECYLKNKACKYSNVKFHRADPRNIPFGLSYSLDVIDHKLDYLEARYTAILLGTHSSQKFVFTEQIKKYTKYLKALVKTIKGEMFMKLIADNDFSYQISNEKHLFINMDAEMKKIAKQLANIKDRNILYKLIEYYDEKISGDLYVLNSLSNDFKNIDRPIDNIIKLQEECLDIGILHMDMYLLGRLLRSYSDNSRAKYSIIVVGDRHAENYSYFLRTIGYKTTFFAHDKLDPVDYETLTHQCLDMKGHLPHLDFTSISTEDSID